MAHLRPPLCGAHLRPPSPTLSTAGVLGPLLRPPSPTRSAAAGLVPLLQPPSPTRSTDLDAATNRRRRMPFAGAPLSSPDYRPRPPNRPATTLCPTLLSEAPDLFSFPRHRTHALRRTPATELALALPEVAPSCCSPRAPSPPRAPARASATAHASPQPCSPNRLAPAISSAPRGLPSTPLASPHSQTPP